MPAGDQRLLVKDLSEHRLSTRVVYDGRLLKVRSDTVRLPDGAAAEREWIEHPGAVAVIAVTDAGELVMERQFRYALGRDMFEIPAGKIDQGEDPLETGKRELQEETGYAAAEWTYVATIHLAIGYSNERIEIYLAKGLRHEQAKLDDHEHRPRDVQDGDEHVVQVPGVAGGTFGEPPVLHARLSRWGDGGPAYAMGTEP